MYLLWSEQPTASGMLAIWLCAQFLQQINKTLWYIAAVIFENSSIQSHYGDIIG